MQKKMVNIPNEYFMFIGFGLGGTILAVLLFWGFNKIKDNIKFRKYQKQEELIALQKQTKANKKQQSNEDPGLEFKEINPAMFKRSSLKGDFWKNGFLYRFRKKNSLVINMQLKNGFWDTFLIKIKNKMPEGFYYNNGFYIFDDKNKYFHVGMKRFCYDYNIDCALPYNKTLPVTEIKNRLKNMNYPTNFSINPHPLRVFLKSKVIENMVRGAGMDIKRVFTFLTIILIVLVIFFLIYLQASGVLEGVRGASGI